MTKEELAIYFNWSCNLLVGDPVSTDRYLREHLDVVKKVASGLLQATDYKPQPLYRGIVMQEEGLDKLEPHSGFTYLSFTEDKKIAEIFADPNHEMAFVLRLRWGINLYGYIAEHTPTVEEILFHHSFLEIFPYVDAILTKDIDASKIHEQKEVTILQPSHSLIITSNQIKCAY